MEAGLLAGRLSSLEKIVTILAHSVKDMVSARLRVNFSLNFHKTEQELGFSSQFP